MDSRRSKLSYLKAMHTGEDMIFPYWEIDQDRRCIRDSGNTVWWPEYASPIVPFKEMKREAIG